MEVKRGTVGEELVSLMRIVIAVELDSREIQLVKRRLVEVKDRQMESENQRQKSCLLSASSYSVPFVSARSLSILRKRPVNRGSPERGEIGCDEPETALFSSAIGV